MLVQIVEGEAYRTSADVSNLAALNYVIQRPHDLLAWYLTIKSVDLKHVNIGSQSLYTGINGLQDVSARKTDAVQEVTRVLSPGRERGGEVPLIVHTKETFSQNYHSGTGDAVFLQSLSHDFFGFAVGVHIGLVKIC